MSFKDLEISWISNKDVIWKYKAKKIKPLPIFALMAPINSKLLSDPFANYELTPEVTKALEEGTKSMSGYEKWFVQNELEFQKWYKANQPPKLSEVPGVNVDYFKDVEHLMEPSTEKLNFLEKTVQGIQDSMNGINNQFKPLIKFCETINKLFEDLSWILHNPLHAFYIVLEFLSRYGAYPIMIYIAINIILSISIQDGETKRKLKKKRIIAILIYIAIIVLQLIFKIALGL